MSTIWTVVALGLVGVALALGNAWRRRNAPANLGVVSDQWISENRLGSTQDSRR